MTLSEKTNRRSVLKTISAGVVGAMLSGTATAGGNLVSEINSSGHYSYFPLGPKYWGRQKHPYDYRKNGSRWLAEPADGGTVRCRVKDIESDEIPNRNAGFDIHLRELESLGDITISSETVQSQASEATLLAGVYLDVDKNGEFGVWEKEKGDIERFDELGDDQEGLLTFDAGGTFTIDDNTGLFLLPRQVLVTWGNLRKGNVEGIDSATPAALYVGIADRGEGSPEEAIIEGVNIQRP